MLSPYSGQKMTQYDVGILSRESLKLKQSKQKADRLAMNWEHEEGWSVGAEGLYSPPVGRHCSEVCEQALRGAPGRPGALAVVLALGWPKMS